MVGDVSTRVSSRPHPAESCRILAYLLVDFYPDSVLAALPHRIERVKSLQEHVRLRREGGHLLAPEERDAAADLRRGTRE